MPTIAKCLTALGDTADAYQGEIDQYVAEGRGPREATIAALTDARNALKSERDSIVAKASKPKPLTWGDLTKEQRAAVEDAAQKMANERAKLSLALGMETAPDTETAAIIERLETATRDRETGKVWSRRGWLHVQTSGQAANELGLEDFWDMEARLEEGFYDPQAKRFYTRVEAAVAIKTVDTYLRAEVLAQYRAQLAAGMLGTPKPGQGLSSDFLQARLDAWARDWQGLKGYTFRAVASEAELPLAARSEAAARRKDGSRSRVKAVFIPGETRETGELVFVASAFRSPREALATLMHEAGLHAGIRRLMGPALDPLLDEVAGDSAKVLTRLREIAAGQGLNLASREGSARAVEIYLDGRDASDQTLMREVGVARAALAYGYDLGNANQRRAAAEEWLAHLAETHEDMALLRRIYAAIRRFLRELGVRVRLRNVDIDYILMSARRAAQEGPGRQAGRMRQAYGPGATTYRAGGPMEMFAGQGAATADSFLLATAEKRVGIYGHDPERVRLDTGWFRGADRKWRFEIVDADAKFKPDWEQYKETPAALYDVLSHPKLEAAYPALNRFGVFLEVDPSYGQEGEFNGRYFVAKGRNEADALSALLHEIQHAIQREEGFAVGGNPEMFLGGVELSNAMQVEFSRGEAAEIQRKADAALEEGRNKDAVSLQLQATNMAAFQAYRRLYGEVEARNVQIRQALSGHERAWNKPPLTTQDVEPGDVIVTFNGEDMLNAPPPANTGAATPPTITVDGAERPTRNSNGQLIHPTEEGIRNFWRWFGDSKVVDDQGRPLVVYHGTGADFSQFEAGKTRDVGFHFGDRQAANYVADRNQSEVSGSNSSVMPVYLAINNPLAIEDTNFSAFQLAGAIADQVDQGNVDGLDSKALRDISGSFDQLRGRPTAAKEAADSTVALLRSNRFDGIAYLNRKEGRGKSFVAFEPTQIKSAIGNTGAFSPDNPDIRFSIGSDIAEDLQGLMDRASAAIRRGDRPRGKNLNFLNRTVGTPFHLSKKFPETFGRFFAKLLDYHNEATNRAIEAERLAPSLFVNLEEGIGKSWKSAGRVYRATKRNRVKPVADAINESTLQERVMSVDELRQRGLDDDQIGTYNQALRAAHHSLDSTAQTFQVMGLRGLIDWLHQGDKSKDRRELSARRANSIIGSNVNEALDIAVDIMQPDIDALKEGVSEANGLLKDARKDLENATQAKDNQWIAQAKQTIAALNDRIRLNTIALDKIGAPSYVNDDGKVVPGRGTLGQIEAIAERVTNLKSKAYFPLMRFGRFTVTVWRTDPETGKREAVWFSKHETETDQRIAYDTMLEEAGADEDVTMGTSNEDQWRLFQGVNMETLQLFADAIDGSTEQGKQYKALMQEHIRLGKAEHNALKRMLKRKGTAGYSDDVQRVLASYLVSNSRLAAGNLHSGDVTASIMDIPKEDGDLAQYATKLYTYLREPREEFSGTRNFMFMWYLGGSAASAIVNLSQVPMVAFPYLSIRGGIRGATAELTKAYAQVAKGIGKNTDTSAFGQAVRRAQLEGVLAPQQIYELEGTARGGGLGPSKILNNPIVAFGRNVWGSLFSAAETINREVTFAAAWNIAKKAGDSDQAAYQYALNAVEETQYLYSRLNRPTWGRGIGAPLMTFKSFTIQTLELWLGRLPMKQKILMGALLIAASGLTGIPGEEDLEDLWDTIARMFFGKAYPSRQALEDAVYWALGESIGNMVMRGVLADMPGDIGSRLGFGDIIPGTGLAMPGQVGGARELAEVVGPISGIAQDVGTAAALAGERDFSRAAYALMPRAIKNAIDGAQAMMTGEAVDKRGRAITDVSPIEGMLKATGINPTRVARLQETKWRLMRRDAYRTQMESAMANRLARALADRDREAAAEARQEIRDWNRRNPSDKIVITRGQIRQRMKTLRLLGNERFLRSMSPELRAEAARALAGG
jgi:hypothetical protein